MVTKSCGTPRSFSVCAPILLHRNRRCPAPAKAMPVQFRTAFHLQAASFRTVLRSASDRYRAAIRLLGSLCFFGLLRSGSGLCILPARRGRRSTLRVPDIALRRVLSRILAHVLNRPLNIILTIA